MQIESITDLTPLKLQYPKTNRHERKKFFINNYLLTIKSASAIHYLYTRAVVTGAV